MKSKSPKNNNNFWQHVLTAVLTVTVAWSALFVVYKAIDSQYAGSMSFRVGPVMIDFTGHPSEFE